MRLSLSPSELDRLTDLVEALHAPFDYPDVDAWRHAVNHHERHGVWGGLTETERGHVDRRPR